MRPRRASYTHCKCLSGHHVMCPGVGVGRPCTLGPWLGVTSAQLAVHALCGPLAGPRVLEVQGTRSTVRSHCHNRNWKLMFQILGDMILPLWMRSKKYARETGSFPPPHSPGSRSKIIIFSRSSNAQQLCPRQPLWPPVKSRCSNSGGGRGVQEEHEGASPAPPRRAAPVSPSTLCPTDSGLRGATFILGVLSIFRVPVYLPVPAYLPLPSCFCFVCQIMRNAVR